MSIICQQGFQQFDVPAKIAVDLLGQRANVRGLSQLGNTLANHLLVTLQVDDNLPEKELHAKVVERGELERINARDPVGRRAR